MWLGYPYMVGLAVAHLFTSTYKYGISYLNMGLHDRLSLGVLVV